MGGNADSPDSSENLPPAAQDRRLFTETWVVQDISESVAGRILNESLCLMV
jgi:hypothetical protein